MQVFLILHIAGALVTAVLLTASGLAIAKNISKYYKKLFWSLNFVAAMQVGSGVGLLVNSHHGSILGFCAGLGAYLSAVVFIQSVLVVKSRKLATN